VIDTKKSDRIKNWPKEERPQERTGLTQEKFTARLGVTFPTINRWENGRAKPSPLALKKIEELLWSLGEQGKDLLVGFFPDKAN
jgi:putative transcriptional regulator